MITRLENKSTLRSRKSTLRDAHVRDSTARNIRSAIYKNNARALLSRILSILNLDWLQHARSVRGVYESKARKIKIEEGKAYHGACST